MQPWDRQRRAAAEALQDGPDSAAAPSRRGHYAARVIHLRPRHRLLAGLAVVVLLCSAAPAAAQSPGADRVRLPFPAYDGTLTPYTFALGYPLVTLVYDTLLWRDARGVPRPWLARSVTRSDGGRRLTVRLRDGVRWHDGRALTAADVAFTFRHVASHYQPRFTPQLQNVRRVSATGPLTAVIELRTPSLGFDDQPLADLPILPRHRWQGLAAGRTAPPGRPVGSGPYRLVSAERSRGYVLRANSGYFRGAPLVREIRVPIIGDADATYEALRKRRVDMLPLNLAEPTAGELGRTLGINVARGASYVGTMLVLNLRRAPFDDLDARRAVGAALDLDRIARRAAPAVAADEGFIHPASRWATHERLERPDLRTGRAGRVLGTRPIRVLAPTGDPVRLEAGRQVVLALRQAGARATLVRRSRTQLERAIGANGGRPDFDAAIASIPALASHDPDGLTRLFGSDRQTAPLNASGYSSDAFDKLAARVASADDERTRQAATGEMIDLLAHDAPAIALFFSRGNFAYRTAAYDGWAFVQGSGILDKRSFLAGATASPSAADAATEEDLAPSASDADSGGIGIATIISLVILAVVVVLALLALRQRWHNVRR